jgi:hypothetical protein
MSESKPATEESKTTLENSVAWLLSDRLGAPGVNIATKKYMTSNNLLVYLTSCSLPEQNVPRIKVQVFQRVDRGVHETGYHLFGDHRFEKYENDMIFGTEPAGADGSARTVVAEAEAEQLLRLVSTLPEARQTI